ncbi:sugar phosphate isomerase/epimerase family protein [Mesorhizobium sp. BAC0120]|uniref:sugar phosphate isomerase/epimerase family protein n=1 Tax=Mesorhizobium sp. BAC0120 TaxID=3090670 RepID=UPI00298D368E|nr:sugar phosphate isomerase/epimerase family protein [Mesorhizobium sp. BAC0120]MDW6022581.1 sugar phosphate isomerase/epimerase family protein [Mesorhizobium sp. BAC0120]
MLEVGLNPYGLTYFLGLQGRGTPRANPNGRGLEGFIELAEELGARTLEIAEAWLGPLSDAELLALRDRLHRLGMTPVVSSGLHHGDFDICVSAAKALGARLIRFALTPILCGDRAAAGERWPELVANVREKLGAYAPRAAAEGLTIVIENHQDFTSRELVAFCEEFGPGVRIVYDTGNSFPVAEAPLDFTRVIAPHVAYVHLKDYRVQWTDEGIRLVRCAIGDGAVPFKELIAILAEHHPTLPAVLEPGALEARHVRLFTPDWWRGYAPKDARALAACLLAARRNRLPDDADYRTPWERNADHELVDYELAMIRRSAANMRTAGIMEGRALA